LHPDITNKIQNNFQELLKHSSDVYEIVSPDFTILWIDAAVEKIIGFNPEERIGKNALEFFEGDQKRELIRKMDAVLENPEEVAWGELVLTDKSGKNNRFTYTMANQLEEPSVRGILILWQYVSESEEKQKAIEYIANHDELTGLPNRIYLSKKLKEMCGEQNDPNYTFALIMLDIDGFRYVNDALGYQLGDQLIVQVSQRLKDFLGRDVFLCRYSGDQFAIILQNLKETWEYEQAAKKITSLFNEAFKVDLYELDVTASLGISLYPHDEKDPGMLINYANISLLRSKHEGKNRYKFYSTDIGIQAYKQVVLRNDLLKAIERNQLRLYYQALVKLDSSDILAAEALIRWDHPEWGTVSPNEFIPIAEETGFIINLGNWMLREVCCNYKRWMEQGMPPIKISVNYSGIQFYERNFTENILNIIWEHGLDPGFLIMEITESVFMKNPEKAIIDIKSLQENGIQVALDDFGTGFSSLSYLNSFNIDILKIDRSFIKNITVDNSSSIITRSVIDLAQELKIKLVAEGIENWEQLACLKEMNCYSGQGFIFNKPMPAEEFEKLLVAEKCQPVLHPGPKKVSNKRKFVRVKIPKVLEADMCIVEQPGLKLKIGNMKVKVKNINANGLCFVSPARLPVNKSVTLKFQIGLKDGGKANIHGYPVWIQETEENLYEYGVEFEHAPSKKTDLAAALYCLCKEMYS